MQSRIVISSVVAILLFIPSFAFSAPGELCFEQSPLTDCNFIEAPLEAMIEPFNAIFGVWFFPIIWGILLGVLWLRTQNTMLVGVVGLIISTTISTFYEPARGIGVLLFLIAAGVTLYHVVRHRSEVVTT